MSCSRWRERSATTRSSSGSPEQIGRGVYVKVLPDGEPAVDSASQQRRARRATDPAAIVRPDKPRRFAASASRSGPTSWSRSQRRGVAADAAALRPEVQAAKRRATVRHELTRTSARTRWAAEEDRHRHDARLSRRDPRRRNASSATRRSCTQGRSALSAGIEALTADPLRPSSFASVCVQFSPSDSVSFAG